MGASVLPFTDGGAKGQSTKGYFLIQDLLGNESLLSFEIVQHIREKKDQGITKSDLARLLAWEPGYGLHITCN